MEALLRRSLSESIRRTAYRGAELDVVSLAALRATREVLAKDEDRRYVAGRPADAPPDIAHFPGKLEPGPQDSGPWGAREGFRGARFLPPQGLDPAGARPHHRLDRAVEMLIGDWLT